MDYFNNKKIMVAGGAGFMGSHVVAALKRVGVEDEKIFIPKFPEFDFRKKEDCARALSVGVDVVFNCAAVPGDIELRAKIPGDLFYENLLLSIQLIEAANRFKVEKFVEVGSATEYPAGAPSPFNEDDLWNGLPSSGNIPYGLSKRIGALAGAMYRRQSGLNFIHLLLTNAYGPGEKFSSGYMMPSLIQKTLAAKKKNEKEIEVWGTGRVVRDVIYVEDVADAIIKAAALYNEEAPLNIGTGTGISLKDLVVLLCEIAGFEGRVYWNTQKPEGDMVRLMDTSRALKYLNFTPQVVLRDGLKKTISWHLENPEII